MFRTITLSVIAVVAATSFASANDIFVDLAKQDDDRAAVRALSKTNVNGVPFSSKGNGAQDIFISLAKQDNDRAAVRALSGKSSSGVAFSSKGSNISALEVAYKHALENDDRQLARHIAKKLGL